MFWRTSFVLVAASIAAAAPVTTRQNLPCGENIRAYGPSMETISEGGYPVATTNFDVSKSGASETTQTMTFPQLPSGATACSLGWSVPAERNFVVSGNGYTPVFATNSTGEVGKRIGAADFTYWPATSGAHDHSVGAVPCDTLPSFLIGLQEDGDVFIEQDSETGWFLEYTC